MKAIVVTDQAAGTAGMTLVERPEPEAAGNDVLVEVHASGFTPGELTWPSAWTDRLGRDRTPSIPGHELAGVVSALGYGTTGLSVGQRVFGLTDWTRDGTLAEYVAVEARNLAPLPGDVDFTVGASLPISGLTAWQGLFEHGRLRAGQSVLVHGAAGGVGSTVTQLAREAGAHVIGTGRAADRQTALDFGAQEFIDLENDALEDVGGVDLVFDVIGGDIGKRSAGLVRAGGTLVTTAGRPRRGPPTAWRSTSSSCPIAPNWARSSGECGTDDYGRSSATSRPSTTPSPPSTRPSGSWERRSSAFVREGSAAAIGSACSWISVCHAL
jgi:NADPH:quinone reductase-like Zn-dependent oxidoreductase